MPLFKNYITMKNHPFIKIFMVFTAIFSLVACDDEPLEGEFGETPAPLIASFKADFDGETFVADQSSAITWMGNTTITGTKDNGETVTLSFSGSGIGTYSLLPAANGSASYQPGDDSHLYVNEFENDTLGVVEITKYDLVNQVASGTFKFMASRYVDPEVDSLGIETIVFTNGIFENIPLQSDVVTQPEDQNFQVELDGELLVGEIITATLNSDGLKISATNGVKKIGFQIFDPVIGSFDLSDETNALVVYDPDYTNDEDFLFYSSEGTITITSLNEIEGSVSGDFSGILTELFGSAENIEMTNGIFENISFSTETSSDFCTALINGESFDATIFPIVTAGGTIQVTFSNDLEDSITLVFPSGVSPGTYPITAFPEAYSGKYTDTTDLDETIYNSVPGTGEIIITSIENNVLVGSFHFDAEDGTGNTVNITEGEFSIDIN